jgi:hypothetical protein
VPVQDIRANTVHGIPPLRNSSQSVANRCDLVSIANVPSNPILKWANLL